MEKELLLYRNINGINIPFPSAKNIFSDTSYTKENPFIIDNPNQNGEKYIETDIYCDLLGGKEYRMSMRFDTNFSTNKYDGIDIYMLKDKKYKTFFSILGYRVDFPDIELKKIITNDSIELIIRPSDSGRYYLRLDNNKAGTVANVWDIFIGENVFYEQISLTNFTFNAQRMAATPTITSSFNYPRCLDNEWDVNVFAEYKGEKYYIRQIPSSSKDNKSVMYKHDITLYSERFVLENIYLYDVDKNDDTNVIIRCNLDEFTKVVNKSFEKSKLPYSIVVSDEIKDTEKALEVKDISLDKVYLSVALQEIYNQWGIPYYFDGTQIIVKDCSIHIKDTDALEYGHDKSLLSIKKNNANFRKITRCSGYGSDKNIPFFYPNLSQKGVIDIEPLESNKIITKNMLSITDMRKFDKLMPLNGKVVYKSQDDEQGSIISDKPSLQQFTLYLGGSAGRNAGTFDKQIMSFSSDKKDCYVTTSFKVKVEDRFDILYKEYKDYQIIGWATAQMHDLYAWLCADISFEDSFVISSGGTKCLTSVIKSDETHELSWVNSSKTCIMNREFDVQITSLISKDDLFAIDVENQYFLKLICKIYSNEHIKRGNTTIARGRKNAVSPIIDIKGRDSNHSASFTLTEFNVGYAYNKEFDKGWYLNDIKKIELSEIGVNVNGTLNEKTWNNEGFSQVMVSKIPIASNLMPPLYRDSLGLEKFYNAKDNTYLNEDGEYYDFETEWNEVNQNEHIQPFEDIYPTITGIVNANNEPFDEIIDIAFDENDNNDVDEEGNFLHPYFYVKIPKYDGANGFNLFDHKIVGGNMQVSFTSGDCSACVFEIMVKTRTNAENETYEDVLNPIKTSNGKIVGNWEQITSGVFGFSEFTQQDSKENSIWLILKKDTETFNETYPNLLKGVTPNIGDKFVLLNIEMPQQYIESAEEKLRKNVIQYMWENNFDKWNFNIDFSRIFLQENKEFRDVLTENAKVDVKYNDSIYSFYINDYKYEVKNNEALPKISIGLADTLSIKRGITQTIASGIMKDVQTQMNGYASLNDLNEQFLRKRYDEIMPNNMTFEKKVEIGDNLFVKNGIKSKEINSFDYSGDKMEDSGFHLGIEEDNGSLLVVDNIVARKSIKAFEYVIQQIKSQGGIVMQSMGSMECINVETYDTYYRCYFDTKNGSIYNQFEINDLAQCRRIGLDVKYYWRKVIGIGDDYIDLSIEDCDSGSDTPSIGDIIIQFGNTTNRDRQSVIVMSTYGENAPSTIMYSGINSYNIEDKDISGTKYVLSKEFVDDNGNTIYSEEGYPHFFNYGSMHLGSRDKESNYISYEYNKDTKRFELIINAKTTFKSGTQNISDILASIDGTANNAQSTANEANQNATNANNNATQAQNTANSASEIASQANNTANNANNTANKTKEDLDNLSIGGENLVLGAYQYPNKDNAFGFTSDKNDDYVPYPELYVSLEKGHEYTFTAYTDGLWNNIQVRTTDKNPKQVDSFILHKELGVSAHVHLTGRSSARMLPDGRLYSCFTAPENGEYYIRFDIDYIGNTHKFWQVQVEKGSVPTDWKPAEIDTVKPLYDALKGSTEIEGGLINTNVLMVKNSKNAIIGGVSGQSTDNIAFWSGGTLTDAINGNCNVIIRKDGTAKIGSFIVKDGYVEVKLDSGGYARMNTDGIRIFDNNNIVRTKLIGGNVSNSLFESKLKAQLIQRGPESKTFTFTKSSENSSSPGVLSMPLLNVIKNTNKLNVSVGIAFNLSSSYYNPNFKNAASLYASVELTKDGEAYRTLSGGTFTYQGGNFYNDNGDMIQYITIKNELEYQDLPLGNYGIDFKIGEVSSANFPAPTGFWFSSTVSARTSESHGIIANLMIEDPSTIIGVNGVMTFQRTNQYFGAYTDPADNQFKIIGKGDVVNIEQN